MVVEFHDMLSNELVIPLRKSLRYTAKRPEEVSVWIKWVITGPVRTTQRIFNYWLTDFNNTQARGNRYIVIVRGHNLR